MSTRQTNINYYLLKVKIMKNLNTKLAIVNTVTTIGGVLVTDLAHAEILKAAQEVLKAAKEGDQVAKDTGSQVVREQAEMLAELGKTLVGVYDQIDLEKHTGTETLYSIDVTSLLGEKTFVYGVKLETITQDGIMSQIKDVNKDLETQQELSDQLGGASSKIKGNIAGLESTRKKLVDLYDAWCDECVKTTLENINK